MSKHNKTMEQYRAELKEVKQANREKRMELIIQKEKEKYSGEKKKLSTSKLIVLYLFILLNVVLFFTMFAIWHFQDLSYLSVLISDIVGQVTTYLIYSVKATKENTVGGISYDLAMANQNNIAG